MPHSNYWSPRRSSPTKDEAEIMSIYVSETGDVRVETKHLRQSFAPADFIARWRSAVNRHTEKLVSLSNNPAKNNSSVFIIALCGLLFFAGCTARSESIDPAAAVERIVTVGGSVTETAFALGAEKKIVGADTSSLFPESATRLPQVGYQRQLSSEGVLSLKPTLVLAISEVGPPAAIEQIEAAGVKVVRVAGENSIAGATTKIRQIAKALNAEAEGDDLIKKLHADLQKSNDCAARLSNKSKVVFIYARGAGAANVGGRGTAADEMIRLAGGVNAVTEFENYKPLTPESLVVAQPDVILLPTRGLESLGGVDGLLKLPGIAETPAGKNKRIVTVDDLLLLGFGPRTGAGVLELCEKLRQ